MSPKFFPLTVKEIRKLTKDAVSIEFDIPKTEQAHFQYTSGQYLTLKTNIAGAEVRRSYSLCSSPFENKWIVAIKKIENGIFSNFATQKLRVGDQIEVMNPMGNFSLQSASGKPRSIVLFAAGSGITPMLSIAKTLLHEEPDSDVTLFYGNQGFKTIIFREELEALKNTYMNRFRLVHIFSRESLGTKILQGRIDYEKCLALHTAFLKNQTIDGVYICGPETMILEVRDCLTSLGIDKEKIHFELFHAGLAKKETHKEEIVTGLASEVEVIIDGDIISLALHTNGENILDAAQKAGGDLPYACKGGVCCTCKAKVIEGTVSMDVNYALDEEEVANGYILTCQSHPTSERVLITFDE